MKARITKKSNKRNGFTLVELIVVIAIIGILAGMMLPRFGNFTNDAKNAAFESDVKSLVDMVEVYKAKNGSLPTKAMFTYVSDTTSPYEGSLVFSDSNTDTVGTTTISNIADIVVGTTDFANAGVTWNTDDTSLPSFIIDSGEEKVTVDFSTGVLTTSSTDY